MKKLLLVMLIISMLLPTAYASDEPEPLTSAELNAFTQGLIERAIEDKLTVEKDGEGYFVHGRGYMLELQSEDLSPDSLVKSALIDIESIDVSGLTAPRVTVVTQAAGAVLASYPTDNPSLKGTDREAVLYLRGNLPSDVHVGKLTRSGQMITLIEYAIYTQDGDSVGEIGLQYTINNGYVSAIRYYTAENIALAEAEMRMESLSALQEENSYFAYDTVSPQPLEREDLSIQGLDFIDLSPEIAERMLGDALAKERLSDSDGNFIETADWENLKIVFIYDNSGKFLYTKSIVAIGDVEGPRGIRLGENMVSVLSRFPNQTESLSGEHTLLYGAEGENSAYGVLKQDKSEQALYVNLPMDDYNILFTCRFVDEIAAEFSLSR